MIMRQDGEPHVLHELAEQWRTLVDKKGNKQVFDCHLHREAISLTKKCFGHLNAKTTGVRPAGTTAFAMLCKSKFEAEGCDAGSYVDLIKHVIAETRCAQCGGARRGRRAGSAEMRGRGRELAFIARSSHPHPAEAMRRARQLVVSASVSRRASRRTRR